MPILANILLSIEDNGKLNIIATDSEIEAVFTLDIENLKSKGKTTITVKKLLEIARNMPSGSVLNFSFNSEKMKMKVTSGENRFVLSCLSDTDFPNLKVSIQENNFKISQEKLLTSLKKVSFSMGYQDVRSYLNGVLFEILENDISFVATDGHRLSMTKVVLEEKPSYSGNEEFSRIIVPRKAILEIMRLLDVSIDNVNVCFSKSYLKVDLGNVVFTTKLLEGSYPDYNRVIPQIGPFCLKARTDIFKQALNSVSVLASEQYNGVLFGLKSNNPEMVLQTYNPEQEIAHASIPVDYEGNDLNLGFNIRYLNDVLGVITTDDFQLTLESDQGSALIKQLDDPNTQHVVMPIRI